VDLKAVRFAKSSSFVLYPAIYNRSFRYWTVWMFSDRRFTTFR